MRSLYRLYFIVAASLIPIHILISQGFATICTFNRGVAFGFFSSASHYLLITLAVLALAILVFAWKVFFTEKRYEPEYQVIFLTVLAGLSNVFDRLTHGAVCDYISLPFSLPVVNLNDIVISANVIFLSLILFKYGNSSR